MRREGKPDTRHEAVLRSVCFTWAGAKCGFRRCLPLGVSVFAYGLVFGILAVQVGLSAVQAGAMSLTTMEWMIQSGIRLFDPGMGGVHKAFRGFVSTPSYSLHRFFDPRLHLAMDSFIPEYNHMEMREIAALNSILPYRQRV